MIYGCSDVAHYAPLPRATLGRRRNTPRTQQPNMRLPWVRERAGSPLP